MAMWHGGLDSERVMRHEKWGIRKLWGLGEHLDLWDGMFTLCLVCGMEEIRDTNEERGKKEEIQSVRLKVEEEEEQANSIRAQCRLAQWPHNIYKESETVLLSWIISMHSESFCLHNPMKAWLCISSGRNLSGTKQIRQNVSQYWICALDREVLMQPMYLEHLFF